MVEMSRRPVGSVDGTWLVVALEGKMSSRDDEAMTGAISAKKSYSSLGATSPPLASRLRTFICFTSNSAPSGSFDSVLLEDRTDVGGGDVKEGCWYCWRSGDDQSFGHHEPRPSVKEGLPPTSVGDGAGLTSDDFERAFWRIPSVSFCSWQDVSWFCPTLDFNFRAVDTRPLLVLTLSSIRCTLCEKWASSESVNGVLLPVRADPIECSVETSNLSSALPSFAVKYSLLWWCRIKYSFCDSAAPLVAPAVVVTLSSSAKTTVELTIVFYRQILKIK